MPRVMVCWVIHFLLGFNPQMDVFIVSCTLSQYNQRQEIYSMQCYSLSIGQSFQLNAYAVCLKEDQ